ncbi:hypothetical protein ILFOPFJJ_01564 [Ensifer psoraleae]|nr:hypothetical protein [Sinorhizobium psoraleae]
MQAILQNFALFDLLILAGICFLLICSYLDEGEA